MKFRLPLIVVSDMATARRFYEDVLQQRVILDFGANITFEGDFCLQTRTSWAGFIHRNEADIVQAADNFELYFDEPEFDAFLERLRAFDVELVHEVVECPWGQRVIRFYDPDRNIIEVGEPMEQVVRRMFAQGLSVAEIIERTEHPEEFVVGCL